jgi:hypothetical protein
MRLPDKVATLPRYDQERGQVFVDAEITKMVNELDGGAGLTAAQNVVDEAWQELARKLQTNK